MLADLEFLVELFEPVGRVTFRRMFGGSGVFRDGLMFGIVIDDIVYLKVDDGNRAAFEAEGCEPFRFPRKDGRVTTLSYWTMPERLLDEPDELRDWALASIEVSIRAEAKKGGRKVRPDKKRA